MKKGMGLAIVTAMAGALLSWTGGFHGEAAAKMTELPSDCRLVAENQGLALYVQEKTAAVALLDKESHALWWSKDAEDTDAVSIAYGLPARHGVSSLSNAACTVQVNDSSVTMSYVFGAVGITIPVTYALGEDCLTVSVKTADIQETDAEKQCLTRLSLLRDFGTATSADEGYYVIPDGCGALVRFRSNRREAKDYDRMVYGDNLTSSARQKQTDTEQVYLPMYGVVKNGAGLLAVCSDGDANVRLSAGCTDRKDEEAGLDYRCGFTFVVRETDTYQLNGTAATEEMTAFETGDMQAECLTVRYYPVADVGESGMDYADIAAAYRAYLLREASFQKQVNPTKALPLYLELYGGVEKKRSFLGIPYTTEAALTTAKQGETFLKMLSDAGVTSMKVSCYQWTEESIAGRVEDDLDIAACIGGEKSFRSLQQQADSMGATLYPMVENMRFRSGNGYYGFWDGAVRLNGDDVVTYPYSLVSGKPLTEQPNGYLLSPNVFPKLTQRLVGQSVSRTLGLTAWGSTLYSDHQEDSVSREQTREQVCASLAAMQESMEGILVTAANAYALPYVDGVSRVPMQSSGYDLFDADVPLYQMILHGMCSYAVPPINAAANGDEAVLRAVACGSSLNYTLMGSAASELKQTDLQGLYYADGSAWVEDAAEKSVWAAEILSDVQDVALVGYQEQGHLLTTLYEDGTRMVTDLQKKTVQVHGKIYHLPEKEGDVT